MTDVSVSVVTRTVAPQTEDEQPVLFSRISSHRPFSVAVYEFRGQMTSRSASYYQLKAYKRMVLPRVPVQVRDAVRIFPSKQTFPELALQKY